MASTEAELAEVTAAVAMVAEETEVVAKEELKVVL